MIFLVSCLENPQKPVPSNIDIEPDTLILTTRDNSGKILLKNDGEVKVKWWAESEIQNVEVTPESGEINGFSSEIILIGFSKDPPVAGMISRSKVLFYSYENEKEVLLVIFRKI